MKYRVLKECIDPISLKLLSEGDTFTTGTKYGLQAAAMLEALMDGGFIIYDNPSSLVPGSRVFYLRADGKVRTTYYHDSRSCKRILEQGNCFPTIEACEEESRRRDAQTILLQDTKGFNPDWEDGTQPKYEVGYNHITDDLITSVQYLWNFRTIVFASADDANESIRKHGDLWRIYFGLTQ